MAKRAKKKVTPSDAPTIAAPEEQRRVVRVVETPETEIVDNEGGVSLEDLGQAYAALLNQGDIPYETPVSENEPTASEKPITGLEFLEEPLPATPADAAAELTPRTILEALLFVGHPQNEPLTTKQVAALMRGVSAAEIEDLIQELNEQYTLENCPYTIISEGIGYRLTLREEFSDLRERFYGKVKEARLSQAVVDVLAIVAYHQPLSQQAVDQFRGKPSYGLLNQLVRRQLLQIERQPEKPKEPLYRTTSRFLDLFGLESLDDLPRSQEMG
jgi:segregation and condensation protein B